MNKVKEVTPSGRSLPGGAFWCGASDRATLAGLERRANLVELDVTGSAGRIEGISLRLYNPETRQWSLHFSNSRTGTMSPPTLGAFHERTRRMLR